MQQSSVDSLCPNCEKRSGSKNFSGYYHDTPWNNSGEEYFFCSDECREAWEHPGDFDIFYCGRCGRYICEQNPRQGWHIQYRFNKDNSQICLRCYQKNILKSGIDRSQFEHETVPGMFFSYGNHKAVDAGYTEKDTYYIRSKSDAIKLCTRAIGLIDGGKKVIVAWERLGIGGSEGSVTLITK